MLRLSWTVFRSHWVLFVGAIAGLAVGVALIQSALTVAAAANIVPDLLGLSEVEAEQLRVAYDDVATIMIIATMVAVFLTIFIIATTFSFAVTQRRRDLALFRLIGAMPGQLRRLLIGESLLLAFIGIPIGVLLGHNAVYLHLWLLKQVNFLPPGFALVRTNWPIIIGALIGLGVAVMGVLAASRRAAKVRPLEVLRDQPPAHLTLSRWVVGVGLLLCTAGLVAITPFVGLVAALAISLGIAVCGGVALSLLSPLVVPLVSWLLSLVIGHTTSGLLALAKLRHGVQRSAAVAAPLIVLVALPIGLAGTLAAVTEASQFQQSDLIAGDFVVRTTAAKTDHIATIPGVARAASAIEVPGTVEMTIINENKPKQERYSSGIVAINVADYAATHNLTPINGDWSDLQGATIAATQRSSDGDRIDLGSVAVVRIAGKEISANIGVILPELLSTDKQILVSRDLIAAFLPASSAAQVVIEVAPGIQPASVAEAIRAQQLGEVWSVGDWVNREAITQQGTNQATLVVLLGLAGLYAAMAVVNAVVMAGAHRKREFAIDRLAGFSRSQVVAITVLESLAVSFIGLILGGIVVVAALGSVALAASHTIGAAIVAVPWTLIAAIAVGAIVLIGVTTAATTFTITRHHPIRFASARE